MESRPRPLYVPDLSRTAGADVAPDGSVRCVTCERRVPVGDADIVGMGYRCARCSALATPEDDVDASLKPSEKALVPDLPKRSSLVVAGCALVVVGVLQWVIKVDVPLPKGSLFTWVFMGAIGCFSLALANHRRWG